MHFVIVLKRYAVSLLVLFLLAGFLPASAQESTIILHDPVRNANPDRPITIEARIEGILSIGDVLEARVYYRPQGVDSWEFETLEFQLDKLIGTIPASAVATEGVEYYLEVDLDNGTKITFPSLNADGNPVSVTVLRGDEEAAIESGVVIISPEPDRTYSEEELMVAVAFNQAVFPVEPGAVVLRVDGKDVTGRAQITGDILVAVLENVKNGGHRIDLLVKQGKREKLLRSWLFDYESTTAAEAPGALIDGSVGLDGFNQQYSGVKQNVMSELVNLRLRRGDFKTQLYARITSEEDGSLQPQHRFRLTAGWPKFEIGIGDLSPNYGELVLYGNRVRGAQLKFQPGKFSMNAIYGDMRRGIDGLGYSITGQDTTALLDDQGNVIGNDIYNRYYYDPGTFRRNLAAVRFGYGQATDRVFFGLSLLKVRDDTASVANDRPADLTARLESSQETDVTYGVTPKDNVVVGTDFGANFDRRRIQLTGDVAMSLYNTNIAERPLADLDNLKDIIWVNQYFEPLPDKGLTNEEGLADVNRGEIVSSVLNNAVSWQGKLRLRYYGQDVRTGYKFINRSYTSLGNPTLANDDAGLYIYDRLRLLDSRLYVDAGYRNFHNNVQDKSDRTLTRSEFFIGFSVFTNDTWPDLNFSVRQQANKNNGTLNEVVVDTTANEADPTQGIASFDDRVASNTGSYGFGLSHRMEFSRTQNNLSLNYTLANRVDDYQDFGDSKLQMILFNVATDYSEYAPLTSQLSFSSSNQKAMNDLTSLNYTVVSLRVNYYLYDRSLVPYLNPKLTIGQGDYSLVYDNSVPANPAATAKLQKIDFTRIDWVAGFEWRFMKNHSLIGRASVSTYDERGATVFFDGSSVPTDTGTFNRDDYSLMFSYLYKF